jgi:hypothetical protein
MKHLTFGSSAFRTISWPIFNTFVFICMIATGVSAQHLGGHFGGSGHVSSPAASHPGISRPASPVRPPLVSPATRSFQVRPPGNRDLLAPRFRVGYPYPRRPIFPRRPFFPIGGFPPPSFGIFGRPFFGAVFGWRFGPGFWIGCDPIWSWGYGCDGLLAYDYGTVFSPYSLGSNYPQPQMEVQNWPVYYGEPNSQFVQLFLKDGTVYTVTDYWLVNGELHYKVVEENGTKVVEHEMDFGLLDLQKSVDINTQRGFRFVLRNEPLEQYLKDYMSPDSPNGAPPEPSPAGPAQVLPQSPAPGR